MPSLSGNTYVDTILWGNWVWSPNPGPGLEITYFFANDFSEAWTQVEKDSYVAALQAWADVADFTIREVATSGDAVLIAHTVSDSEMQGLTGTSGVLGFHDTPEDGAVSGQADGYFNWESYSLPSAGWVWDTAGLAVGGWGHYTFLHELGHGLGLAHPHDTGGGSTVMPGVTSSSSFGTNDQNQGLFTVMSYNAGWAAVQDPEGNGVSAYGYSAGPGAYDIAAIQFKYGANTTHNAGNDTYLLPEQGGWLGIWDVGGIDTIRYNGHADAVIDLNPASLDGSTTGGGAPSYVVNDASNNYYGGFTIAADFTDALADQGGETGVIIENATGGWGNDTITGNGVGNVLLGRNGDDNIDGGNGDDMLRGGNGADSLLGGRDNDTLKGQAQDDKLRGGNGSDTLRGGSGDDMLNGGLGERDKMWGNSGADEFVYKAGFGHDLVMDFEDNVDTLRIDDALWGNAPLSVQDVLDTYATDIGDHIRLDFGNGDVLIIRNVANISDLSDDILII